MCASLLRRSARWAMHLCLMLGTALPATAQGISVAPTRLEVPGDAAQTTLAVRSTRQSGAVIQMRVFAWTEGTAADQLRPTQAVAISPPMAQLGPRQELTARIVRLAGTAPRGRECYRVLVDRLPDASRPPGQISLRIRHSVPLCFSN